jgi:hypothetical protein
LVLPRCRDLDILVQDKRDVVRELQAELDRVTAELNALAIDAQHDHARADADEDGVPSEDDIARVGAEVW